MWESCPFNTLFRGASDILLSPMDKKHSLYYCYSLHKHDKRQAVQNCTSHSVRHSAIGWNPMSMAAPFTNVNCFFFRYIHNISACVGRTPAQRYLLWIDLYKCDHNYFQLFITVCPMILWRCSFARLDATPPIYKNILWSTIAYLSFRALTGQSYIIILCVLLGRRW